VIYCLGWEEDCLSHNNPKGTTMGNWGSENFTVLGNSVKPGKLEEIIEEFPSGLKQAMFAAASHGIIKRHTWNGCALNAAGIEVGSPKEVRSFLTAAKAFNITASQAKLFVAFWDAMPGSDEHCTNFLRETIEKVGLFSEPGQKPPRILKKKVYESQQTQLRNQFETLMAANQVPDVEFALELLGAAV
jgi:hypothetical protein